MVDQFVPDLVANCSSEMAESSSHPLPTLSNTPQFKKPRRQSTSPVNGHYFAHEHD